MRNPCLDTALRELTEHGIRDVEVAHGSKHPQAPVLKRHMHALEQRMAELEAKLKVSQAS